VTYVSTEYRKMLTVRYWMVQRVPIGAYRTSPRDLVVMSWKR
jgi:hypothetical protein